MSTTPERKPGMSVREAGQKAARPSKKSMVLNFTR